MIDQRRDPRVPARFPVTCEIRGGSTQMQALNISRGGLLITSPAPLPVGSVVTLRFTLGPAGELEIKGLVRHSVAEGTCGVEFVEALPNQQEKLAAYLSATAASAAVT